MFFMQSNYISMLKSSGVVRLAALLGTGRWVCVADSSNGVFAVSAARVSASGACRFIGMTVLFCKHNLLGIGIDTLHFWSMHCCPTTNMSIDGLYVTNGTFDRALKQ
jgi:hypothetical protein